HGGGFATGAGADHDARRLSVRGDVLTVTVNYRLGVFGLFAHPGLGADSGTYALQDQQEALRWVRRNIAAFGGDPGKVTLAGQSSGAAMVCGQLTSPQAAGLFHRAIVESGTCSLNWPKNTLEPGGPAHAYWVARARARQRGTAAAEKLGC